MRHGRGQKCDESLNGAGQWWAAKLHIHCPDPTKTPYTLLVLGENSLHFGASRHLLAGWLRVQKTHKRKKSLRLMRYKFKEDIENITLYVYMYTTTILLQGI